MKSSKKMLQGGGELLSETLGQYTKSEWKEAAASLDDLLYERYWRSIEAGMYELPGMTAEEYAKYLKGIERLEDIAVLDKIDYVEILELRNKGVVNSRGEGVSYAKINKDTIISPEIKEKILWGERKNPNKNEIIGGHSPGINNNHYNFAVEEIKINADGTKNIKFTTQFPDGNLAKIKSSTVFPDGWTDNKIIESIQKIGNSDAISVRSRDGATWHRGIVDGIEIDVLKNGDKVISAYPTGTKEAFPPSSFKK